MFECFPFGYHPAATGWVSFISSVTLIPHPTLTLEMFLEAFALKVTVMAWTLFGIKFPFPKTSHCHVLITVYVSFFPARPRMCIMVFSYRIFFSPVNQIYLDQLVLHILRFPLPLILKGPNYRHNGVELWALNTFLQIMDFFSVCFLLTSSVMFYILWLTGLCLQQQTAVYTFLFIWCLLENLHNDTVIYFFILSFNRLFL